SGGTVTSNSSPEQAYGDYDEDLIEEIPAEDFAFDDADGELEVGLEVEMMDEEGEIIEGTIVGVDNGMVLVDLNPPLAGKTIRYAGRVLNVREPSEEELDWGFPESLLDELFGEEDDYDEE
ncbi:MAG: hypothetical protein AAFV93_17105, partial [Chloroflexota bacterium]